MDEALLGPAAGLAVALMVLGMLATGRIISRNTVPREDFKQLQDVNATQAEGLKAVTTALNELVTVVRHQQKNGGL